jgi:hypothetical protein
MNFKVSQLKSLTAGEVAVDDLIYVIDSNPTDGSVKSKKVTVGDLIDSRIYGISSSQFVLITGYYADPSWISSLDWSKITNAPSFVTSLSALTDVQLSTPLSGQALVYNGTKWVNQGIGELDTLATVTTRGNTTTNNITVGTLYFGNASHYLVTDNSTYAMLSSNRTLQLSTSGNPVLSVFTTQNVAIGTTTDSGYKLNVNGTIRTTGTSTNGVIFYDGTYGAKVSMSSYVFTIEKEGTYGITTYLFKYNDGTAALSLTGNTTILGIGGGDDAVMLSRNVYARADAAFGFTTYGSTTKYKAIQALFTDNSTSGVAFNYKTGGTDTEAMRITSAGRVGIGTTSPTNAVHIRTAAGGATSNYALVWQESTGDRVLGYLGADNSAFFSGALYLYQNGVSNTKITANGTSYLMGGNVLVGTTTDAGYKLDVNGTVRVQGNSIIKGSDDTNQNFALQITNLSGTTKFQVGNGGQNVRFDQWQNIAGTTNISWIGGGGISIAVSVNTSNQAYTGITYTGGQSGASTTGSYTSLYLAPLINQTGASGAITRAIHINPTLTSAYDFRAIDITGGKIVVTSSITAVSALAQGVYFNNTLVAAANNDVLVGLDINPTFTNGAFTGTENIHIRSISAVNATVVKNILLKNTGIGDNSGVSIGFNNLAANNLSHAFIKSYYRSGTAAGMQLSFGTGGGASLVSEGTVALVLNGDQTANFTGKVTANSGGFQATGTSANMLMSDNGTPVITRNGGSGIQFLKDAYWQTFSIFTNNVENLRVASTGNVLIGTTTDAGYKLDVNGTARVSTLYFTNAAATANITATGGSLEFNAPTSFGVFNFNCGGGGRRVSLNGTSSNTVGNTLLSIPYVIQDNTGTGRDFIMLNINPTINNTGSYTGTVRGFYYNPTLTSLTGTTHRAIETTSGDVIFNGGNVGIGTSSPTNPLTIAKSGSNNYFNFEPSATGTAPFIQAFYQGQVDARLYFNNTSLTLRYAGTTLLYGLNCGNITASGSVALLGTSDQYLHLFGSTNNYVRFTDSGEANIGVIGTADATTYIQVRTGAATSMSTGTLSTVFFNSGNVGINTTTDAGYKLDVNGTVRMQGNIDFGTSAVSSTITLPQSTGWTDFVLTNFNQANTGVRFRNPTGTRTITIGGANLDLTAIGTIQGGTLKAANLTLTSTTISGFNNAQLDLNGDNVILNSRTNTASPIRILSGNAGTTSKGTVYISDYSNLATGVNSSAALQVDSTVQGFLPPRMTTIQKNAISSPATGLEVYDSTTNTPNYFNGTTWVGVASNQSTGLSPGLFSQTSDSVAVTNTTVESSLISTGVGTLSVPANGFQVGAAYIAYFSGVMSSQNNATMEIHLRSNGFVLANTDSMILSATTGKFWELHVNFVIRAVGGGGVAAIVTSGRFSYNKNSGNNPESLGFSDVNNTTFDTTVNNTLAVTATWGNASPSNSIQTRIFNLYRVY